MSYSLSQLHLGYPAPREKTIFTTPPKKIADFEVKNRRKSEERSKSKDLLFASVIFRSYEIRSTLGKRSSTKLYQ